MAGKFEMYTDKGGQVPLPAQGRQRGGHRRRRSLRDQGQREERYRLGAEERARRFGRRPDRVVARLRPGLRAGWLCHRRTLNRGPRVRWRRWPDLRFRGHVSCGAFVYRPGSVNTGLCLLAKIRVPRTPKACCPPGEGRAR